MRNGLPPQKIDLFRSSVVEDLKFALVDIQNKLGLVKSPQGEFYEGIYLAGMFK